MKNITDNNFRIFLVIFMIWIAFCAFNFSKNGRYQSTSEAGYPIIDTHTGDLYYFKGGEKKIIKLSIK